MLSLLLGGVQDLLGLGDVAARVPQVVEMEDLLQTLIDNNLKPSAKFHIQQHDLRKQAQGGKQQHELREQAQGVKRKALDGAILTLTKALKTD